MFISCLFDVLVGGRTSAPAEKVLTVWSPEFLALTDCFTSDINISSGATSIINFALPVYAL